MRRLVCSLILLFVGAEVLVACGDGLSSATEHADLQAQVETLRSQFDAVVATNAEVGELRAQVETLTSQLDEAVATEAEAVELHAHVEYLTSQLVEAETELAEVNSQNSELRSTVGDLEGSLATAETAVPTTVAPVVSIAIEVPEPEVELILTGVYSWGPSSTAEALQTVLGVVADGWYGNQTRSTHLTELEARGLPTDGVPTPPTTTGAPAETTTTAVAD
ncbi:MAG: hypothetical protein P6E94_01495 [Acidimicrobiales bacterium]|nr:hypothetical protein [Acidimicrobiales bacterium]